MRCCGLGPAHAVTPSCQRRLAKGRPAGSVCQRAEEGVRVRGAGLRGLRLWRGTRHGSDITSLAERRRLTARAQVSAPVFDVG